jgi:hypothetical protein
VWQPLGPSIQVLPLGLLSRLLLLLLLLLLCSWFSCLHLHSTGCPGAC